MPAKQSRVTRAVLWIATALLVVPISRSVAEGAWLQLVILIGSAAAVIVSIVRQRMLDRLIADQRSTEEALRASEAMFSGILGIAADAIITVDQTQRILHFNQGAEHIFGYSSKDIVGRHLSLLIPKRYRDVHEQHIERFARSPEGARRMGERREIFGLRGDGTEFSAEASISKLVAADGILFTVVLRDITDRKRAEEDERFMSETSRELARSLDLEQAARMTADLAVPRLADAALVDIVTPGDTLHRVAGTRERPELTAAVERLAALPVTKDSPSPVIDVIRRRRPETVAVIDAEWLEANEEPAAAEAWRALGARAMLVVPLIVGEETLGAITLAAVDVGRTFTPEHVALATKFASAAAVTIENAQLYGAAQSANRARDEVLSVVSHDLRNPISAIAMCARTLDESPPDDPASRRELMATIRESAAWTNRLIQDLVDVSSIEQGRLSLRAEPVDAAQLVLQARHMFEVEAANHGIELCQEIPTNLPLVMADGERMVQVFGNLLRNAIKFTPSGGRITVGAKSEDDAVVFTVRDSGPGIRVEDQSRVFDRYWHSSVGARHRGTGLGLSIAKGIVEAHGGRIWLESVPGAGATFSFSVPASRGAG